MSTASSIPALELKDLRKSFGKTEIIRGVDLVVMPGENVAIIGDVTVLRDYIEQDPAQAWAR